MPNPLQQLGSDSQGNPEDQFLYQSDQMKPNVIQYNPNTFTQPTQGQPAPSEAGIGDLQGRYNTSMGYANNPNETGLGALAHGIASIFLGHKLAKANAAAEGNRKRLEDLKLQSEINKSETDKITLKEAQQKLLDQQGHIAYSKLLLGDFSDPEDIKKAKVMTDENGHPMTFGQKYYKDIAGGKHAKALSLDELSIFNGALSSFKNRIHSQYAEEEFNKALKDATNKYQKRQSDLIDLKKSYNSRTSPEANHYKTYVDITRNGNDMLQNASDPRLGYSPEGQKIQQSLLKYGLENIDLAHKFAKKYGIDEGALDVSPKAALGAVDGSISQNPAPVEKYVKDSTAAMNNAMKKAQTPAGAPSQVKTKEAPIPVGTNAAPAEATPPPLNQKALQVLGE